MAVVGIGGLFLRSRDPQARAEWYARALGIDATTEGQDAIWHQQEGPTVVAAFAADSTYFADDQPVMLNLRVQDLDGMIARLDAAGTAVERRPEWETEYGRFVRIVDPEGMPIELWEVPS